MKYKLILVAAVAFSLVAVASHESTLAALNDVESPEGNFFYMGSVDFRVGWNLSRNNVSEEDQIPIDNPYSIFDERNITPGDHGEATIGLYNQDNPAYIEFWANQTGDSENGHVPGEYRKERLCSTVKNYYKGDDYSAQRNGGSQIVYKVEQKKGSYIELQAPNDNEIGENGRSGTDRFEFELDGKPANLTIQIESLNQIDYIELAEGESREVLSGAFTVEVVEVEEIGGNEYRVILEVESDEDDSTPGLDGLNIDFCGGLSYYQVDFAKGDVVKEIGDEGVYGPDLITAVHGNTLEEKSGGWGSSQCVTTDHFETDLEEEKITIRFTVKDGCHEKLTFASYEKPSGGNFDPDELDDQVLIDYHTENYGPGTHEVTIDLPQRPVLKHLVGLPEDSVEMWYSFEQESGHIEDVSGNDRDGSNSGALRGIPGSEGKAIDFDREEFVETPSINYIDGDFSITFDVKKRTDWDDEMVFIFGSDSEDRELKYGKEGNKMRFSYYDGSGHHGVTGSEPATDGEWQKVAITYDSSEGDWTIYQNCRKDAQKNDEADIDLSGHDNFVGKGSVEGEGLLFGLDASIDDFRVYNRTLSADEIESSCDEKILEKEDEDGKGELGDWLHFTLWYDDGDNIRQDGESIIFNGTAHELDQSDIGNGILLDANLSEFGVQQVMNDPLFIGFKWWLPENAKCEVQTDSKKFDFQWSAKQERHNMFKLIDTPNFLGDEEYSADNYFEAGEFPECQESGECGPIKNLEDGSTHTVTRTGDNGEYQAEYEVTRDSNNSVKFEDPNVDGLGEEGAMESETFTVKVYGETNDTVYVKTKAGQFEGSAMLQGEGDIEVDTSNLWTLELVEINDMGEYTEYRIKVTSDSEEGRASPALSHIIFQFCEPISKEGYYQLDLEENQIHQPEAGKTHPDLFMAGLSARDDGGTRLNPSFLDNGRKPDNVELLEDKFIIEDGKATVKFRVEDHPVTLSLAAYEMPGPYSGWKSPEMDLQVLHDAVIDEFAPGNHRLTVELPTGKYPKPGQKDLDTEESQENNSAKSAQEDSMLSHWRMDGLTGQVNDSQNLKNGQNIGANRGAEGRDGNSFRFDGTDSVRVDHVPEYELENGTVMAWFKMEDEEENWLFSKDQDSCTLDCGHLSISYGTSFIKPDGLGARIQNQGGGAGDVILEADPSKKRIESGEWHHVALSFGEKGAKLYVDGELHDSDPDKDGITGNTLPIVMGERYDGTGRGLKGNLDDVRIYNHQVSGAQIEEVIANASTGGDEESSIDEKEVIGLQNNTYSFDGDQYEKINHSSDLELSEGTVSMSFRMNDETRNWIFTKDENSCSGDCGHLSLAYKSSFINSDGLGLRLQSDSGNGDVILEPSTSVDSGKWYDVAVSFGSEGTKLYVNGTLEDSDASKKGLVNNQLPIILGHRYDLANGRGLDGDIKDLRFYSAQLDDSEIRSIHEDDQIAAPPVPGS